MPLVKETASAIALVLTFLLFVPYIRSIKQQTTVPHVFSWIVWAFGTFVVFLAQLADGGGVGAWPIGFSACITAYVALLSYRARSNIEITRQDWVLFSLAILAIPGWVIASDPFWAVLFLTIADLLGFGPTLRKAYRNPYQEHMGFFALGGVRNLLVVIALEHYSWTTLLFPVAVGLSCLLVALFLAIRRAAVVPEGLEEAHENSIQTGKSGLVLKSLRPSDAASLHALVQNNADHLTALGDYGEVVAMSLDETRQQLAELPGTSLAMGIYLREQLIGRVDLNAPKAGTYVLGYWIDSQHGGHGYTYTACRALIDHATDFCEGRAFWAGVKASNTPSIAILEKLGFHLVEELPTHLRYHLARQVADGGT